MGISRIFCAAMLACMLELSQAQYYGSQMPPATNYNTQSQQYYQQQQLHQQQQQQYAIAQARYQKQLAAYNAAQKARAAALKQHQAAASAMNQAASRQPTAQQYNQYQRQQANPNQQQYSPAAANAYSVAYHRQAQVSPSSSGTASTQQQAYTQQQYQQYYQRQQQQQQQQRQQQQLRQQQQQRRQQQQLSAQNYNKPQQSWGSAQQQQRQQPYQQYQQPQRQPSTGYQQYGSGYRSPMVTVAPTTTPVPGEIEFEYENPTTTTTSAPPRASYNQWRSYSNTGQGYNSGFGGQGQAFNTQPAYAQTGYNNNNYYQQPQPSGQQQQQTGYNQNPWPSQTAQQGPPPANQGDPFSGKSQVNGLQPTIFNPQYQPPPQPQSQQQFGQGGMNDFGGSFGTQNPMMGNNPSPPQGKMPFGAKGPNPIQLNQFMAQPAPPTGTNTLTKSLDALLESLLSGSGIQASNAQPQRPTPKPTTATPMTRQGPSLMSNRLNDFILGPKSQYRSNAFSEIPINAASYNSLNPLAGFMGEKPPPPPTTTPQPVGRNGDFLAGFIGINRDPPKPAGAKGAEAHRPNIYFYNYMADHAQTTPPTPSAPAPSSNSALDNLGTQDLSMLVQKLLGVLATKQAGMQG